MCSDQGPAANSDSSQRTRGLRVGLFAGLLVSACAPQSEAPVATQEHAQPLIGGEVTEGDPAVVALTRGGSASFCTGTLISPRVILTAAHCIDMLGSDPSADVFFGSDTREAGQRFAVRRKKQHPMWTGDLSGGNDIGMLLMEHPYTDPSIAKELNQTSLASAHVGDDYRHVGFGVYDRNTGAADGQKRQGTTTITGTQGDVILSGDSELSVCFGDSGGPAFLTIDDREVIAGVHSYTTGENCRPPNGDTDVQQFAEDFIIPWIQENDESCELDGVCGPVGCIDDPDCQPCGPDGTCVEDCELPDPDCETQELGEICRAETQCTTEFCVSYRPDPDYRFCTEACDLANDNCPSGMSCQTINPFGPICYYDDAPPGALGDSCEDPAACGSYKCEHDVCVVTCDLSIGRGCPENFLCETQDEGENYYCFEEPSDGGGCSTSQSGSAGSLGFVLLALLWGRRRTSREERPATRS